MTSYRSVIAVNFPEIILDSNNNPIYVNGEAKYQNKIKYLPIDYQEDRSVTANSHIVTQPLQNGDTMADHMYRDPVSFSMKGKFALNGRNWNNDSYNILSNSGDRLASVQWVFEYIKNAGLLCTITTVATDVDVPDNVYYETDDKGSDVLIGNITPSKTRFLTRNNMALTGINWTEKQNVLDFSFTFTEVIMIDTEEFEVDYSDEDLPNLMYPKAQSIGTAMFESGKLPEYIIKVLKDHGYITNEFFKWCADTGEDIGIIMKTVIVIGIAAGIIVGAVAVTAAIGGIAATASALGSAALIFPVGTIVAAAAAGIIATVAGIAAIINHHEKEQKKKLAFDAANGKGPESMRRLQNLIFDVEKAVNKMSGNITIYNFSSDEDQTVCISIGGRYYFLTITSLNSYPYWKADIRVNSDGEEGTPISHRFSEWDPCTNILELNQNVNMWFIDEDRTYEVYLVNPALGDEYNKDEASKTTIRKKLTQYSIWVSKGHIREQIEKISDTINEAILDHDFKI